MNNVTRSRWLKFFSSFANAGGIVNFTVPPVCPCTDAENVEAEYGIK